MWPVNFRECVEHPDVLSMETAQSFHSICTVPPPATPIFNSLSKSACFQTQACQMLGELQTALAIQGGHLTANHVDSFTSAFESFELEVEADTATVLSRT